MNQNSENSGGELFTPLDETEQTEAQPETQVINFNVNDARIAEVKEEFKDVDAYKDMDAAKKAKTALTKMRTTLADAHKEKKAKSLAYGRMLDTEKNRLLALICDIEDPIKKQIKDIKEAADREEEERLEKIHENLERLASYAADRHDLTVEQIQERRANLAKEPLTEEIYQELLDTAKLQHEESDTKLRIVLQRELDAEEERKKQARITEENAAQKKKLDERQAEMDKEEEDRKAAQKKIDDEAAAAQKKKDNERQAELDQQAKEQKATQKKIDDENDRIAQEQADKEESERKAAQEEEDRLAELARAPDRDKLQAFCSDIDQLIGNKPTMESQEGANTMLFAVGQLVELAETVRKCVEEMK